MKDVVEEVEGEAEGRVEVGEVKEEAEDLDLQIPSEVPVLILPLAYLDLWRLRNGVRGASPRSSRLKSLWSSYIRCFPGWNQ